MYLLNTVTRAGGTKQTEAVEKKGRHTDKARKSIGIIFSLFSLQKQYYTKSLLCTCHIQAFVRPQRSTHIVRFFLIYNVGTESSPRMTLLKFRNKQKKRDEKKNDCLRLFYAS